MQVVYALPERQLVLSLTLPAGSSLLAAAEAALAGGQLPLQSLEGLELGVFGKLEKEPAQRVLQDGERVEIYRPLLVDPKEARKARAARVRAAKGLKP